MDDTSSSLIDPSFSNFLNTTRTSGEIPAIPVLVCDALVGAIVGIDEKRVPSLRQIGVIHSKAMILRCDVASASSQIYAGLVPRRWCKELQRGTWQRGSSLFHKGRDRSHQLPSKMP